MEENANLEQRLFAANCRVHDALKALSAKVSMGSWEEYQVAMRQALDLERQVAAAKGEEYAELLDFPLKWDNTNAMPHLLVRQDRAMLAFFHEEMLTGDDSSPFAPEGGAGPEQELLAIVEFQGCARACLSSLNHDWFALHPLHGKGLDAFQAHRIVNSKLVSDLAANPADNGAPHPEFSHYLFWFQCSTFECVAQSFQVETHRMGMKDALSRMAERLEV